LDVGARRSLVLHQELRSRRRERKQAEEGSEQQWAGEPGSDRRLGEVEPATDAALGRESLQGDRDGHEASECRERSKRMRER
jgi:hypothetical protein